MKYHVIGDDLCNQTIVIGKSTCVRSQQHALFLKHYENSVTKLAPIICHTPWLLLLPPHYIMRRHKHIHFLNFLMNIGNVEQNKWIKSIQHIQEHIQKWIQTKHHSTYKWSNVLKEHNPTMSNSATQHKSMLFMWKVNTSLSNRVLCFDMLEQPILLHDILHNKHNQHVRMIVSFSHIWFNDNSRTCGLGIDVLQLQTQHTHPLQVCAFKPLFTYCLSFGIEYSL